MRLNNDSIKGEGICVKHWLSSVLITLLWLPTVYAGDRIADQRVAVQLIAQAKTISFQCAQPFTIVDADQSIELLPGVYSFSLEHVKAAQQRFHLFSKTFPLNEVEEEAAYLKSWKDKGYSPVSLTIGKQLLTASGRPLDARVHWISIVQTATEAEANAKQAALNKESQWTWMRPEVTAVGNGTVQLRGTTGAQSLQLPITIRSASPVSVSNVDVGFWDANLQKQSYGGQLEVTITAGGQLELLEHIPVEDYLQGVLPSEMPYSWPLEALKAQAVAARSDVLVNLSTKHSLERYDFCNTEHCRAYRGLNQHKPQTDEALAKTRGEILVHGGSIAPALFSSNCGGWTENNDTVWFGPPNEALRGRSDLLTPMAPPFDRAGKLHLWFSQPPEANCSGDSTGYRWTRRFTEKELLATLRNKHKLSSIQRIELGERGESGRLKWIRIHTGKEPVLIKKELPIRQALGGLPSAMFDLSVSGSAPNRVFVLNGGGRGHGVGMCQHGANGMAQRGHSHTEILQHYFTDTQIEKVQ
jgi:stage II sporulation protein D